MAENSENAVNPSRMYVDDFDWNMAFQSSSYWRPENSGEVLSPDPISYALPAVSQLNTSSLYLGDFDGVAEPNANIVLSPDPISSARPVAEMESQDQLESNVELSSTRKRRDKCAVERSWRVSFELFEDQVGECYILKMHEIETGVENIYQLHQSKKGDKLVVTVKKLSLQQENIMVPVAEVANLSIPSKYNLSLQERLEGWIVQKRKRNTSRVCDKYYIHEKVRHSFRSLNEVAIFIIYSCRREDIVLERNKKNEGVPSGQGIEGLDPMTEEDFEVFSYALNNPITDLVKI